MIYTSSGTVELFAEVKTARPDGWTSPYSWSALFDLSCVHGDAVAIHTNPRWGGSFKLLDQARKHTDKPILAKGIHTKDDDVRRALDVGANMVLVVGRIPKVHKELCLIEPLGLDGLYKIPPELKVVWNTNDLLALFRSINGSSKRAPKRPSWIEARTVRPTGWMCLASNIQHYSDIQPGADAILVGSHLPEFIVSLKAF